MKLLLVVLSLLLRSTSAWKPNPTVNCTAGQFTGLDEEIVDGITISSFYGIPYTTYPGRFKMATDIKISGDFMATTRPPACAQFPGFPLHDYEKFAHSEDCLYLNIFRRKNTEPDDRKPVAVILHGGAFFAGHSLEALYSGRPLAAIGDFIVVNLNYRLGILGFSYLRDVIPANIGLNDQELALRWVKRYISCFGGNPNNIILLGASAGAISITAHLFAYKESDERFADGPLFSSAWIDSGVLDSVFVTPELQDSKVRRVMEKLNCSDSTCLFNKDVETLFGGVFAIAMEPPALPFVPTVGGIIAESARDLIDKGICELCDKVDLYVGHNEDEGTMFAPIVVLGTFPTIHNEKQFLIHCGILAAVSNFPPILQALAVDLAPPDLKEAVAQIYYNESSDHHSAGDFIGDGVFNCPIYNFINSLQRHSDRIYHYVFNRKLKAHYMNISPQTFGAYHLTSWMSITGSMLDQSIVPVPPEDASFFKHRISELSDLVRRPRGRPPKFCELLWPNFEEVSHQYIHVNEDGAKIEKDSYVGLRCKKVFSYLPYAWVQTEKEEEVAVNFPGRASLVLFPPGANATESSFYLILHNSGMATKFEIQLSKEYGKNVPLIGEPTEVPQTDEYQALKSNASLTRLYALNVGPMGKTGYNRYRLEIRFFDPSRTVLRAYYGYVRKPWMENDWVSISQKTLGQLLIPGTRSSLSYDEQFSTDSEYLEWQAQDRCVYLQLKHGARALDFRIRASVDPKNQSVFVFHSDADGSRRVPLDQALTDVVTFVRQNRKEIVLIHFSKLVNVNENAAEQLESLIRNILSQLIYTPSPGVSMHNVWQIDMIAASQPIAIFFPVESMLADKFAGSLDRSEKLYSESISKQYDNDLNNFLISQGASKKNRSLFATDLAVQANGSIRDTARNNNWKLTATLQQRKDVRSVLNIVFVDFIASTDLVEIAIEYNTRKPDF